MDITARLQQGNSTSVFQALQLIFFAVFGAID